MSINEHFLIFQKRTPYTHILLQNTRFPSLAKGKSCAIASLEKRTLLSGYSKTDLFWLRYRVDTQVRKDFAFHDEIRWAELYGRLERTIKTEEVEDGAYAGTRRWLSQAKEVPGISPAVFARLLKSCIFMRITDLGFKLPAYDEHIIRLEMDDLQKQQYDWLNVRMLEYVTTGWESSKQDRTIAQKLLGVWLQNCLGRSSSGFRAETVMYSVNKKLKLPIPLFEEDVLDSTGFGAREYPVPYSLFTEGIVPGDIKEDDVVIPVQPKEQFALHLEPVVPDGGLLPKEEWLQDYVAHELSNDRKVLLYVRQTGTRDIQPRLKEILEDVGVRAVILPSTLAPAKREAWIHKHIADIDVLITNPRRVETGLDLVMFSTAIFYEIEYSLFTIWQLNTSPKQMFNIK